MTNCNQEWIEFPAVKRRKVQAAFSGGDITSDGGALLLRDMDRRLGLLESVNRVLHDPRDSDRVVHSRLSRLRQRIYGLCLGYEDLNDHQDVNQHAKLTRNWGETASNFDHPLKSVILRYFTGVTWDSRV